MLDSNSYTTQEESKSDELSLTGVMSDFIRSAAYSGVQSPIDGGCQFINHAVQMDIVTAPKLIAAPDECEFGSARWHAQQIGAGVGMAGDLWALSKVPGIKKAFSGLPGAATAASIDCAVAESMGTKIAGAALRGAVAGAVYEGVFRPVDVAADTPVGQTEAVFWQQRMINATAGGITFGTIAAANTAHRAWAGVEGSAARVATRAPALRVLEHGLTGAVLSGAAGGFVNAETMALLNEHRLATTKEVGSTVYTFAVVGGGLYGMHRLSNRISSGLERGNGTAVPPVGEEAAQSKLTVAVSETQTRPEALETQNNAAELAKSDTSGRPAELAAETIVTAQEIAAKEQGIPFNQYTEAIMDSAEFYARSGKPADQAAFVALKLVVDCGAPLNAVTRAAVMAPEIASLPLDARFDALQKCDVAQRGPAAAADYDPQMRGRSFPTFDQDPESSEHRKRMDAMPSKERSDEISRQKHGDRVRALGFPITEETIAVRESQYMWRLRWHNDLVNEMARQLVLRCGAPVNDHTVEAAKTKAISSLEPEARFDALRQHDVAIRGVAAEADFNMDMRGKPTPQPPLPPLSPYASGRRRGLRR